MKILAIDPSSKVLGWALFDTEREGPLTCGTIDSQNEPYENRVAYMVGQIHGLWKFWHFEEIAIEEPSHISQMALRYTAMAIRKWAEGFKKHPSGSITVYRYNPGTWKASFVGNGAAKSPEVQAIVKLTYPTICFSNEHEADAIGIGSQHMAARNWEALKRKAIG